MKNPEFNIPIQIYETYYNTALSSHGRTNNEH